MRIQWAWNFLPSRALAELADFSVPQTTYVHRSNSRISLMLIHITSSYAPQTKAGLQTIQLDIHNDFVISPTLHDSSNSTGAHPTPRTYRHYYRRTRFSNYLRFREPFYRVSNSPKLRSGIQVILCTGDTLGVFPRQLSGEMERRNMDTQAGGRILQHSYCQPVHWGERARVVHPNLL